MIGIPLRRTMLTRAVAGSFAAIRPLLFGRGEAGAHFEAYNPSDLVARRNFLLWSEQLDNAAWAKSNSSITPDATTAPDGSVTADKLVEASGAATPHFVSFAGAGAYLGSGTATLYVKAAGRDMCALGLLQSGGLQYAAIADLTAGTIAVNSVDLGSQYSAPAAFAIAAVGGGWFRVTVTQSTTIGWAGVRIYPVSRSAGMTYAGDGVSGIYVWGAQIEKGAVATTYQRVTDWTTEYLAAAVEAIGMWQDAAGTIPVTAVEQPVGKWVDKSGRGNHATQSTAGARPTLSARYNLLTKTEDFSDAAWGINTGTSAITKSGTQIGTLTFQATPLSQTSFVVPVSAVAAFYVLSVEARSSTGKKFRLKSYSGASGDDQFSGDFATTSNWARFSFALPIATTYTGGAPNFSIVNEAAGLGGSIDVRFPDFRATDDAAKIIPAYQRVNTATDYDTNGFPHYLRLDGSDDGLATGNVDFTAFDKVSVWASHTSLNSATSAALLELTVNSSTTAGSFGLIAPNVGVAAVHFRAGGTTPGGGVGGGATAPSTAVATCLADIPAPLAALRINGVAASSVTSSQGTGTFANAPLYIGRRGGTALPFNGRIHSLTVRASSTPSSEKFIALMNRYAARRMGITI